MFTVDEVLARARRAATVPAKYILGGGKTTPAGDSPLDERGGCDCSAFACWCLGISKVAPFAWMKPVNGGWYSTDGIVWDALVERTGFFTEVIEPDPGPAPGDLVVLPARWMALRLLDNANAEVAHFADVPAISKQPKVGHVGLITKVRASTSHHDPAAVMRVIHCSSGNLRRLGTAIAETDASVFAVPLYIYARCEVLAR